MQNVGLFFEPTVEYQYLTASSASLSVLGPGADVEIEVFLADSWALRLSPTSRYYKTWEKGADTSFTKCGVTWGISAYF
jgi:steroid 5-alpha reductase family enzyme